MNPATTAVRPGRRVAHGQVPFWLMTFVLAAAMLGTTLPTPLYVIYQAEWHFSSTTVTLVFAVYAIAVLTVLLVAGRASDQVGRKPVLAVALGCSAVSTALFILATNVAAGCSSAASSPGLSACAMIGAATAGLTELLQESDRSLRVAGGRRSQHGRGRAGAADGRAVRAVPARTRPCWCSRSTWACWPSRCSRWPRCRKRSPEAAADSAARGPGSPRPQGRGEFVAAGMAASFSAFRADRAVHRHWPRAS